MISAKKIEKLISKINVTPTGQTDEKLNEILTVQEESKKTTPAASEPNIWRIIMTSKTIKFATIAVIIVGVLIGINYFGGSIDGSSVAFAQVINKIRNSSYSFELVVEPIASTSEDATPITAKGMVYDLNKIRLNWVEGDVEVSTVIDYDRKQILQMLHKSKLGRIYPYDTKTKEGISFLFNKSIEELWGLKDGSEKFIGEKDLDGNPATGFKVIQNGYEIVIWANSNNGFPLYVIATSVKKNDAAAAKWVMKNFDFENELDEKLFSLDAPDEYTIVNQHGKVIRNAVTADENDSTDSETIKAKHVPGLLLDPLKGVGSVRFGMNREQIIKILGKPDQLIGKHCLDYSSTLGFSLLVHPKRGLLAFDCWSKNEKSTEGHLCGVDFTGKTRENIGINSTRKEIISIYGNEYKESLRKQPNIFALYYPRLNAIFELKNNRVVHISLNAAK